MARRGFGRLPGGAETHVFELRLPNGSAALVTDLGASLVGLRCPDRDGAIEDIVLACDSGAALLASRAYFGGVIGRVAGRIADARIDFGDRELRLTANHGAHQMHGGLFGLSGRCWRAAAVDDTDPAIRFEIYSPDGDEGYPGNLKVSATWTLAPPCRVSILIEATCDAPTPFNPTIHPYFNLDGHANGSLADHRLILAASRFTPIGAECLPTGTIEPVAGTGFDFRAARPVLGGGQPAVGGYDHNFVIDHGGTANATAAILASMRSGRMLTLRTDRPCVHLYTGGNLGGIAGKGGAHYGAGAGMCLEPQGFPDAFRHAAFPEDWLLPGAIFSSVTVYDIGIG